MRFLRKSISGLFLLCATIGLLAFAVETVRSAISDRMGGDGRPGGGRERVFAVNVVPFTPETQTPILSVFGEVQSARTLDLRPDVGGRVEFLHEGFRNGGLVQQGDLLLQIDPSSAQTTLALLGADILDAEAELADAEGALLLAQEDLQSANEQLDLRTKALDRQQDLVARNVGTAPALEAAELANASAKQAVVQRRQNIQSATARVQRAQATIARLDINRAEAERQLAATKLVAEFDGALDQVTILKGGLVAPNERIGRLIDPSSLEVAFRVSTPQYGRLIDDAGAFTVKEVTATLDIEGVEISATGAVSGESASVGEGQTGRQIFAKLNETAGMRPGDFVKVDIKEPALQFVAKLPSAALGADNTVLVLGDEDRLESAEVDLLRRQNDFVLVRSRGLRDRSIVAERSPILGVGIKVRPLAPTQPGEAVIAEAPEMVEISDEDRAKMIAFIEGNTRMPKAAKDRVLGQLAKPKVPAQLVERLKGRIGG